MKYLLIVVCLCGMLGAMRSPKRSDAQIDVLLMKYKTDATAPEITKKHRRLGISRIISYPDGFIPVLIPEDKFEEVKKLFPGRVLKLSPGLEN